MVAAHYQVGAACVLAEYRMEYCFAGPGIEHVKAVAGDHHAIGREVQVDHLANRGIAHVGGDVTGFQLAQKHVNQHTVCRKIFHCHMAQLFVGAVHRVAGLEGHHALPATLGDLAANCHCGAEGIGEVLLKIGVIEHFDRT